MTMPIKVEITFNNGRSVIFVDTTGHHKTFRSYASDICSKPWMLYENIMIHTDHISIIKEVTE